MGEVASDFSDQPLGGLFTRNAVGDFDCAAVEEQEANGMVAGPAARGRPLVGDLANIGQRQGAVAGEEEELSHDEQVGGVEAEVIGAKEG